MGFEVEPTNVNEAIDDDLLHLIVWIKMKNK